MTLTAPAPIEVRPIEAPRYHAALKFTTFCNLNYAALVERFLELGPEERGDDLLDFMRTQFDLYGKVS